MSTSPRTETSATYEIRLDEGKEDDDHMVIMDPNDAPILLLHNQRADKTYAYGYQRPQINDSIVEPLEPGTQPKNNRFLQTPKFISIIQSYLSQENPNNKELNELKKAISEMVQNMKTLIQKQNENKKPATNSTPNLLQAMSTQPCPYQS
ncbi:26138_t:CDS:2, partial [Gigaspora margarita]